MKMVVRRKTRGNKVNTISSIALCILMICVELGNKHYFLGLKISYWGCLIFATAVVLDVLKNRFKLFSENTHVRKFQAFMLIWLTYSIMQSCVSALMGYNASEGIILHTLNVIITVFLLANANSKKGILRYINTIAIMMMICCIISFWELRTGQHIVEITYWEKYNKLPFAIFYNQNDYCTFLCLGITLLTLGYKISDAKKTKLVYLAISTVSAYIAIETESRASYICLILFFVMVFWYALSRYLLKRNVFISSIFMAIGVLILIMFLGGVSKLLNIFDPDRLIIYSEAWDSIRKNFIFGYGPSMLAELLGHAPHNLYLQMLGDYGLGITLGFAYFTLVYFLKTAAKWKNRYYSLLSAFAVLLPIIGCSSSNIQRIRIFWMAIAICFAIAQIDRPHKAVNNTSVACSE